MASYQHHVNVSGAVPASWLQSMPAPKLVLLLDQANQSLMPRDSMPAIPAGDQLEKSGVESLQPARIPVGLCMILHPFEMRESAFVVRQVIQATAAWR